MKVGKDKAFKIAMGNAAALIESMDLEQLFGDQDIEANAENFTEAQRKVATVLRLTAERMK